MAAGRVWAVWLPAVAWAAAIFALSSVPALDSGLGWWDYVLRKAAHCAEFAVLAALLARAVRDLPAFALAVLFAVSDELHQVFVPGRAGTMLDVGIDATGALAGVLVLRRLS